MGRATFQSEISPLRFAAVEMTEGAWQRSGQFAPGNDCMLPADTVISSGGTRRYGWQRFWALMKRRVERSPVTMVLATFRREISPLRFAAVEMTGRGSVLVNLLPGLTVCFLPASSSRAEERAGMGTKTLGSNETQSREISCHHGACHVSE